MKAKIRYLYSAFFISLIFFLFNIHHAYAVDELRLAGIVKEIDTRGKIVSVDVKSNQCPGLKRFKIDDISQLNGASIGKGIIFFIDSSSCQQGVLHRMILQKGKRQ